MWRIKAPHSGDGIGYKFSKENIEMTQLLCQTDSYIKEFDATVVEVNQPENAIALDRTAFYPGGGGQPNDVGMIFVTDDYLPITKVKSQAGLVWHWIDGALPAVGTKVEGHLNWDHRYKLMRTHTALHVLCGVVWRDYGALVTGGNMEPAQRPDGF
jgi:misacylated tRNA(Ala) deacylase